VELLAGQRSNFRECEGVASCPRPFALVLPPFCATAMDALQGTDMTLTIRWRAGGVCSINPSARTSRELPLVRFDRFECFLSPSSLSFQAYLCSSLESYALEVPLRYPICSPWRSFLSHRCWSAFSLSVQTLTWYDILPFIAFSS